MVDLDALKRRQKNRNLEKAFPKESFLWWERLSRNKVFYLPKSKFLPVAQVRARPIEV
jgi:hypothetical protein